jgi:hypothetical protein
MGLHLNLEQVLCQSQTGIIFDPFNFSLCESQPNGLRICLSAQVLYTWDLFCFDQEFVLKTLIFCALMMTTVPLLAQYAPFDCLDLSTHEKGSEIYQEMRTIQKDLIQNHQPLTLPATAVGYCQDLSRTFLPMFLTPVENTLPSKCAGFTFSVQKRDEASAKISDIMNFQTAQVRGNDSIIQIQISDVTYTLPICLDVLDELIGQPEATSKK